MIQLENDFLKLTLSEEGGEWKSLVDKERNQELLFQGNPCSWSSQAPFLFPIVGRLKDGRYFHQGQRYELGTHGFLRHRRLESNQPSPEKVILRLKSDEESIKLYPFQFEIFLTIELQQKEILTEVCVENLSSQEMPFSFGAHPGFKIQPDDPTTRLIFTPATAEQWRETQQKTQRIPAVGDGVSTPSQESCSQMTKGSSASEYPGAFAPRQAVYEGAVIQSWKPFCAKEQRGTEVAFNDTLVVQNLQSVQVITPQVTLQLSMFPIHTMAIWAPYFQGMREYDRCLCLEPWWGESDHQGTTQQITEKEGAYRLNPGCRQRLTYRIATR